MKKESKTDCRSCYVPFKECFNHTTPCCEDCWHEIADGVYMFHPDHIKDFWETHKEADQCAVIARPVE